LEKFTRRTTEMNMNETLAALKKLEKQLAKETKRFAKQQEKAAKLLADAIKQAEKGKLSKGMDNGDLTEAIGGLMFETEDEVYALEDAVGNDLAAEDEEEEVEEDDADRDFSEEE
jgi:hypothetical protein